MRPSLISGFADAVALRYFELQCSVKGERLSASAQQHLLFERVFNHPPEGKPLVVLKSRQIGFSCAMAAAAQAVLNAGGKVLLVFPNFNMMHHCAKKMGSHDNLVMTSESSLLCSLNSRGTFDLIVFDEGNFFKDLKRAV